MPAKTFTIEAIFKAIDNISRPLAKIKGSLAGVGAAGSKAFKGLNSIADKGLGAVGKMSDALGVAGVASIAGLGLEMANVMSVGRQFEKTLIRTGTAFETPVKVGTKGFAELTAAARRVGETTEFTAQQAAEGLNSLATAGYTTEQSIAALPGIIDFASAATLELGQASDITSDTLGAFGLRSEDAAENTANMARVMDVLTRAAADSTTNVAELFEGVRAGGAFAKTAGASLETFAALQGILANKGMKGAEAGTAVRNAYLHLTSQTKQAAEAQAKLGVKTAKFKDGSIDMVTTIGRFSKATAKLSKDQKAQAISTIFGAFAVGPFLALMDAGEGSIREFAGNLEGAGGTAKTFAASMRESTDAKILMFWNKIESLRLTVFEAIAPTVLSIADAVGKWVTSNQDLIKTNVTTFATELAANLPVIWQWLERIVKFGAGFLAFALSVKAVNTAIAAYELATKLAAGATWLLQTASSAMISVLASNWFLVVQLKVAQLASRAATILTTAATWLYNAALSAGRLATTRFTLAQVASKVAQVASNAVTWLANAAQVAYAAVVSATSAAVTAYTIATGRSVPVIGAQNAALAPLLITVGALLAAVGALYLAWDQFNKLDKSLEGSGGVWGTVKKMSEMGTFDPFEAHDAVMNEKARAAAAERNKGAPQVVTPQERAASEAAAQGAPGQGGEVSGTITVKQEPGTKASVKNKGRIPIKLEQSGAFP